MNSPVFSWRAALMLLAAVTLAGSCSDGTPKTYPVKGQVVFKGKGGNIHQLVGGKVRLQSVTDPGVTAVGEIEDDGVFSLGAYYQGRGLPGVPAGQYKARVEPPVDDEEGKPIRGLIHPRYEDFDKSGWIITVPLTGDLVLEVERTR